MSLLEKELEEFVLVWTADAIQQGKKNGNTVNFEVVNGVDLESFANIASNYIAKVTQFDVPFTVFFIQGKLKVKSVFEATKNIDKNVN